MRSLTAICAATTLISAIVATHLWTELRSERQLNAQLQQRVARIVSSPPASTPGAVAPAAPAQGEPHATAPAAAHVPAAAAAPAASIVRSRIEPALNTRELLKDPEFRENMAVTMRSTLGQMYPDLARELGLTPEQTGKLLDVIARSQLANLATSNGLAFPDEASMKELSKAAEENTRKQESEISALLGDAKYQRWKEYQSTLGVRLEVNRLQSALEASGQALEEYQKKSLMDGLVADQKSQAAVAQRPLRPAGSAPTDVASVLEESLKVGEARNSHTLEVASAYLTAQQLEVMRKLQSQQSSMMRAMLRAQRLQADSSTGSAADTAVAGPAAPR